MTTEHRSAEHRSDDIAAALRACTRVGGQGAQEAVARVAASGRLADLVDEASRHKVLGLVTRVVPLSQLDSEVRRLARRLKGFSPLILALGKQAIYGSASLDYAGALTYLKEMVALVASSDDLAEGVNAFLAKRAPEFKGR